MKKIGIGLILFYLVAVLLLYLFQERIIFQATKLPKDYVFDFDGDFQESFLYTSNGDSLNTLFFKAQGESKGLIFYCHGNRRNLKTWGRFMVDFTSRGYDVFLWDYRGFGKSSGVPSEKVIFEDAQLLYDQVSEKYPESSIVLYGRSLGTGVAAYLASRNHPNQLILETPYVSMVDVGYRHFPLIPYSWLVKHPFDTGSIIHKVTCPIHVFHGTEDELVPYESSIQLASILGENPKSLITTLEGGHHRGLSRFDAYQEKLDDLLR